MKVVITKVDQVFFDGEAFSLHAPGSAGEMTILGEHMPLVTTLKEGVLEVRETADAHPKSFPITGGVMEVRRDGVTVIL